MMQDLFLTFYQRVTLWNLVGGHNASSIKEASVYLRILEKIRLTDEETREANFKIQGNQFSWNLPSNNYGDLIVHLEKDEMDTLRSMIENLSPVRVSDADWLLRIVETLSLTSKEV